MPRRSLTIGTTVALGLSLSHLPAGLPSASATVVRALDLEAKLELSDAVVHGVVERLETLRSGDRGVIGSKVYIRVFEAFRGPLAAGDGFVLARAGGTVDGVTEWIPGLHRYAVGDEVIVLAERAAVGWVAVGIGIGTYAIERAAGCPLGDPSCGQVRFAPDVAQATADGVLRPVAPSVEGWPELRARLRAATGVTPSERVAPPAPGGSSSTR